MADLHGELTALIDDPMAFVADPRDELRRLAASLLGERVGDEGVAARLADLLASDPAAAVRAAAAQSLARSRDPRPLLAASGDEAPTVREAVAFALGEVGDRRAVPWLAEAAAADADDATREAAVAALGAIGDDQAVPLLVELTTSAPPKVRRRAVVALSAFDGPQADAAIRAARADRNPMVKEVAEMVVGPEESH